MVMDENKPKKSSLLKWGDEPKATAGISATEIVTPDNAVNPVATPAPEAENVMQPVKAEAAAPSVEPLQSNVTDVQATTPTAEVKEERVERDVPIARREDRKPAYASKEVKALNDKAQKGYEVLTPSEREVVNESVKSTAPEYEPDEDLEEDSSDDVRTAYSMTSVNGGQSDGGEYEYATADDEEEDYDPFGEYVKPSREVYDAIKAKEGRGEKLTRDEETQKFIFENHPGKMPNVPKYKEYEVLEMPPAANYTKNYERAYANMLAKMKAYGDDPASKAKRAKAARAARIIAMIGDLLQASANMWGAYKGAQSAKLTSMSKTVRDEERKEEAMAMKRANQYVKELETARKTDRDIARAIDSRALAQWRALNKARADAARYTYMGQRDQANRSISIFQNKGIKFLQGLRDIELKYGKEYLEGVKQRNKLEAQNNASALRRGEIAAREESQKNVAAYKQNLKGKGGNGTNANNEKKEKNWLGT